MTLSSTNARELVPTFRKCAFLGLAVCAKEIDVVDESDEEIQRVLQEKDVQSTKKSIKFAIQAFRAFGDLQTAEESVENLDKRLARFFIIFCMNILVFRYNNTDIIITSGNISPNPPRPGSINDNNNM